MKSLKFKYFVLGIVFSSVLFMSIATFGASVKQKIEVVFEDLKYSINGTDLQIKNNSGKQLQPIKYNGVEYIPLTNEITKGLNLSSSIDTKSKKLNIDSPTITKAISIYVDQKLINLNPGSGDTAQTFIYKGQIYLPAEAVSTSLDKTYKWDRKTNSIYIGKYDSMSPSVWLDSMQEFNYQKSDSYNMQKRGWDSMKDSDSTGASYKHGIIYTMSDSYSAEKNSQFTEYLLNQKYSKFKGSFVMNSDSKNVDLDNVMRVYSDGEVIYESPILKAGILPINFDIDVKGTIKLKVEIVNRTSQRANYNYNVAIVNPGLFE